MLNSDSRIEGSELRTAVCGDVLEPHEYRVVNGAVYCVIQYGKHKGELCECADAVLEANRP